MKHFLLPTISLLALALPTIAEDAKTISTAFTEDFSKGHEKWQPTDVKAWRLHEEDGNQSLELFQASKYKPLHRSPFNIALLKDSAYGDFTMTLRMKTTKAAYGHRDLCLIFGHQNPNQFYYVHLGEKTDDHANQIFIVNEAPRIKISTETSAGTPWKEETWHQVKLVRKASSGEILVYFDDMEKPVMQAMDKTFGSGGIGVGSFDDTGLFDDIEIAPMVP